MPAEIVTMADCASNYGVFHVPSDSNPHQHYVVVLNGSEGPAHCNCQAFKFAPEGAKDCKHVRRVWEQACLYNPQWRDGQSDPALKPVQLTYDRTIEGESCPACGGPVVAVRRAV